METLTVQVFASEKVRPAFELLERLQPIRIFFFFFSLSPGNFFKNIVSMAQADVVYFHSPINLRSMMIPFARILRKPVLVQWIGSDVLSVISKDLASFYDIGTANQVPVREAITSLLSGPSKLLLNLIISNSKLIILFLKKFVQRHVACSPQLTKSLQRVGIHASYLPILAHIHPELLPFPEDFAILSYVGYHPKYDERSFYGWNSLLRLATDYPELTIFVVGRKRVIGKHPDNIVFLGFLQDIRQVLKRVKAVIRLTYHDGMPRLILEGLSTGRYVIYTQSFPCTFFAENYNDVKLAIEKIRNSVVPNLAGFYFVKQEYNQQTVSKKYFNAFNELKTLFL